MKKRPVAELVPYIIYKIYPPEIKETPNARLWAEEELNTMGSLTRSGIYMASVKLSQAASAISSGQLS